MQRSILGTPYLDRPGEEFGGIEPLGVKPQSLTEMVYDSIRSAIVSMRLMPGTVVSEASLAARLQVSKTPVREALLRLQSIGLVEPDGSRGLRVVRPSESVIREAFEVRIVLEAGLCRQAAERADAEAQAEILDAAKHSLRCAEAGDIRDGFRHWDTSFHRAIRAAAASARLARLAEDAVALSTVLRERDVPEVHDAIQCANQHIAIADAIARGDSEAAARTCEAHIGDVKTMVLSAFRQRFATSTDVQIGTDR